MYVTYDSPSLHSAAMALATQLSLPLQQLRSDDSVAYLCLSQDKLSLMYPGEKPFFIDFLSAKSNYRRLHGGGRGQLIAKACGVKAAQTVSIIDVTAGLGRDAFVLACLSCKVLMIERSAIIGALLNDGLHRLNNNSIAEKLALSLYCGDAKSYLMQLDEAQRPDIIYLDPMHPERSKSAAVKKEMRVLRDVVGCDEDKQALFDVAMRTARKRVVVKWPRKAAAIVSQPCDIQFQGKSTRFDVYLCH